MKTQTANTQMQGVLGYREVLQNHDALLRETKPSIRQIRNLIALAKRYSKVAGLEKAKREQLRSIASTWQKML
jgi:hypothetical protein